MTTHTMDSDTLLQISDPLHTEVGPGTTWSLGNLSEGIPGVPTPLSWTFWHRAMERATMAGFVALGAFPRRCARTVRSPSGAPTAAIFYGRAALSVDCLREVGAAMPGNSPAGVEEQVFGSVRPEADNRNNPKRYPVVALRMPITIASTGRRLRSVQAETREWWARSVANPPETVDAARELLREANARYEVAVRIQTIVTMLAQGAFDAVAKLSAKAGKPGLEVSLFTGMGGVDEVAVAADLWLVSRRKLDMAEFLARHGYHGPDEGEISSRSWREDPAPLQAVLASFAAMPESEEPTAKAAGRAAARKAAEQELFSALPRWRRGPARLALTVAQSLVPKREVGKAAFLQALDVGRLAVRVIGASLPNPDDVNYLTFEEACRGDAVSPEVIAYRRERRDHYRSLRLPQLWTGMPTAEPAESGPAAGSGDVIEGLPVAPGTVEGAARLVLDPGQDTAPLQPGEILVCHTTDPSWVAVFLTAAALVIDVGGPISHGAIVARELGIPCVINTLDGTRRLRDGQRIRVNGTEGRVEVLA